MPGQDLDARQAIFDKLHQSREEIRSILDPPREEGGAPDRGQAGGQFPRSRTMRALLSSRGIGAAGALGAGLLIARPALALRLLRMVPLSMLGKMLFTKALTSLRSKTRTLSARTPGAPP